ncbi:MAG: M20/M25/M40 family metallo-hydrolase, partial [Ignavibacteriales bacterium]|nr:M20/M25/M40 family metallo-hydrolase [Ignavibacteriales bacterium]
MKKIIITVRKIIFLSLILSISISAQAGLFQKIKQMIDSVSTDNLINHIKILEYAGGHKSRVTFTPGNDSAVVYIKNQFDKLEGLTNIEVDTFYISTAQSPYNTQPLVNIIATIEGKVYPEIIYIIGAHYDCSADKMPDWDTLWPTITAPGADDNATGIATLLEIARILADTTFGFKNNYTIKLIAFGAEEKNVPDNKNPSHYGSIHYANNAKARNDIIYGVINLDMLGYNDNYDFQLIVSNSNSKLLSDWLVDVNNIFDIDLILQQLVSSTWTYSDHK